MCVGICARVLGPCLFILGLLSILANILLLFPSWEWRYLHMKQITQKAMQMPGIWGGGLFVSGFFSNISLSNIIVGNSKCLGLFCPMFVSILLSGLALLGSAACFILSGVGLTEGPLCLYNSTHNNMKIQQWDYPFLNYLYEPSLWNSVCIEPSNIVSWNVYFFSALLIISMVEMVLAALQIISAFFGCICGLCEKK
uniref:Transmembrane 4 L6 family member 19 n=1 Tax=Varanus komodoensis TaxID=61221 RepID=A0A8D2L354_VARKO